MIHSHRPARGPSAILMVAVTSTLLIAGCASTPPTCTPAEDRAWASANGSAIQGVTYPDDARQQGLEGQVRLMVTIDDKDTVRQVLVEQSSGHDPLDQAALEAGRAAKFTSPVCSGTKVSRSFAVPVSFKLDANPATR